MELKTYKIKLIVESNNLLVPILLKAFFTENLQVSNLSEFNINYRKRKKIL